MTKHLEMDRRSFLEILGGGIVVCISLGPEELLAQRGPGYPTDLNAYLRIGEDGRVTVFSGKIEMGQGIHTSLAQMLAEELGVGLGSIDMVLGDTDRCPWDMGTFGSLTTRMFGPALRAAGAEARAVLMLLASERLGVPKEQLAAANGVVSVLPTYNWPERQVTYAQLAKGQKITRTLDQKAVLRSVAEFTVMGQSPGRLDATEKVTGTAKYAGDIRLPGMLYASILRPPAHGATSRQGRHLGGRETAWRHRRPRGRPRRGAARRSRVRRRRARAGQGGMDPRPAGGGSGRHLRRAARQGAAALGEGGEGRPHRGARRRIPALRAHLPEGLRRARADRAAHRDRVDRERQAHGLGLDSGALPAAGPGRAGRRLRPQERPRDHALRRRRLRRQERGTAGRRGGAPREGDRQAGAGGLHPRRGVLLRHLRPGVGREDQLRDRRRRQDHPLGVRRLLRRRPCRAALLRRAQRAPARRRRLDG